MLDIKFNPEGFNELSRNVATIVFNQVKDLIENPQNEEKYLTSKEASSLLKISLPTLNDYTKQGFIPSYRIGSTVRYKLSNIDTALTNGLRKYSAKKGGAL